MKTFVQPGAFIELAAPTGGVVSGGVYKIGQLVCVSTGIAAQTIPTTFAITGVFTVTKVGSQAWTPGSPVYWDNANTRFTTTSAAGLTLCGFTASTVASGAGDVLGDVLLDGACRLVV